MMKIIAGKYRGRKLQDFEIEGTRPTSALARESIFNMLVHGDFRLDGSPVIEGKIVLDAFCGTGALGLEAISRGAEQVYFMDNEQKPLDVARQNLRALGEEHRGVCIRNDATNPPPARAACELVFLDPPYRSNVTHKTLANLVANGWLAPHCVIVAEMEKHEDFAAPEGFTLLKSRHYGKTGVYVMRLGSK